MCTIGIGIECLKYDIKLMKKDYSTKLGTLFSPILTLETMPVEEFDQKLDFIVTESEIYSN